MKKLVTLLFTFALAFTLSMPVFAQDTGSSKDQTQAAPKAGKKKLHLSLHKGSKKSKKEAKEEKKETKGEEKPQ